MQAVTGRARRSSSSGALAVAAVLITLLVAALLGGCSGDGGTTELADDTTEVEGPLPTAPEGGADASSGSVDMAELIARIDALTAETDLCRLLTGEALAAVTGADIDFTSLLSDPTTFTELFASLDRLFGHMASIAPPEAQADLNTMKGVWAGLATVDPRAADAEQRSAALVADPQVQQAQENLGNWVQANCAGSLASD